MHARHGGASAFLGLERFVDLLQLEQRFVRHPTQQLNRRGVFRVLREFANVVRIPGAWPAVVAHESVLDAIITREQVQILENQESFSWNGDVDVMIVKRV